MFKGTGRSRTLRAVLMWSALTLTIGCGGGPVGPGDDGGVDAGSMGDMGPGVDGGPIVPPYVVLPLECTGTPPRCQDANGDRNSCEGIPGCDYGYCSYRPLACIAGSRGYCESGCEWDGDFCDRLSYGCQGTSQTDCQRFAACEWSSFSTLPFYDVPCQGIATPCGSFNAGTCTTQVGCSLGCPLGRDECAGACVDTQRDRNHCGECGTSCGAGSTCVGGMCECENPAFTRDPCGVCDANPGNDCVEDCAGVPGGSSVTDDCGTCDANPANDCDCAGVPAGPNEVDMCGTCDAISGNDCVQDCVGAWGGAALVDDCGVCDATPGNDCDCFQVPGGPARMDQCGVCDADAGNDCAIDCSGVWGGPDRLDMCGVCDAAAGNDCVQDCAGNWGGTATPDMCSVCDTNPSNDCVQDCAGMWGGGATVDNCDTCDANPTNDCVCLGATCAASGPCFEGYCDAQTDTCMERAFADGTECGTAGTEICVDTACVTRQCGDRFLESGPAPARETCDDGNVADGDLCSAACVATALRLTPDRGSLRAQIPTVGVDGAGRHLIVWIPDPNAPVMLARRFDAAGAPLESTAFGIPSSAYPSEIAVTGLSGGGWVVTYVQLGMNSNTVVLFRMVASDGTVGSEQVVSSRRGQNREPVITSVGTGFVIVWWVYNTWDGIDSGLVARRYSATGTALSSEFFVAVQRADYQELARVTSQGNTWLVVWQGNPGSGFQPQIRGRFFSLSNPTSGELVFANGTSPTVASLGGGEFAVGYGSWNTPYGVFVRRVPQASPLSQTANMVGWSHSSSPEIMVAPYGSSILVAWRNANIDVSLAAIGPTALNAVDALSANAELATANAWFTLSPSPRGTWFVTSHPGTRDDWLAVTLLRHP